MSPGRVRFSETVRRALAKLGPRQTYAAAVIGGRQAWSGADLKGKAKRFGGSYARQRAKARVAWLESGGDIVAMRRTGKLISAVCIGADDFGAALYADEWGRVLSAASDIR